MFKFATDVQRKLNGLSHESCSHYVDKVDIQGISEKKHVCTVYL